ncbi:Cytochrome P450 [Quillaja saponaria]|uniref:Cytochrome P450 n=1 Tax=Quillaja saponaria TaxID=32244 RepID=A0AAD7M5Y6_QUISA|nr:Cytochrome P450 [Quillaja saponaria]
MSPFTLLITLLLVTVTYILIHVTAFRPKGRKLPPGPLAFPIIGHLHMLGNLPHRTLQSLAKKYGPIMSLRLGNVPTIIVSSPEAAELFLKTHDTVFASRPKLLFNKYVTYGTKGLISSEYGSYWRNVRKLCTTQLLSASKIDLFAPIRREGLVQLVNSVMVSAASGEVVDLSENVSRLMESVSFKMILGGNTFDAKGIIQEVLNLAGAFNLADYVPFLGILDLQGLTRRYKKISTKVDKMLEKIIKEHEQVPKDHERQKDFVDVLLSLMNQPMNPHELTLQMIDKTNVKAIILDMIAGSFDTSATVIEWALSELVKHPRVMKCLQHELDNVVGMNRMVEEEDLTKLNYLDMVVKETLRLHPIGPLLAPHESMEDITLNGYFIQRKSRIIVNAWAIGRDPEVWSKNVEEFYPERFVDKNIDLRGRDFQLIPFGSGRRGCPGLQLGLITVKIVVAQLVHCFNWELPHGMLPNELDMKEKFGLTIPRVNHLLAKPSGRLVE